VRILSITAGAAAMYCGSCLRDNALAAALLARGHDVTLQPVYTPTVTDEPNMSSGRRVLFGGISVYLQEHYGLFRHTPWLLDRLWDAPGVIKRFAARSIDVDPKMLGSLTVSSLKGAHGNQRKEVDKLVASLADEPRPDVVNLPNSLLIALAKPIRDALHCPIVVTLQGEDLFVDGLPEPYRTEARNLIRQQIREVDAFISVSEYYTSYMASYLDIPTEQLHTVPLGVNVHDLVAQSSERDSATPFTIAYLARVAPEKGLHNLVEAYRILRQERSLQSARLHVAGYLAGAQHSYLEEQQRKLASAGLGGEFKYFGVVDRAAKVAFLHDADVLCVPTDYVESKGLFVLEAMACGVPVVQPHHGAFPEMIRRTGGGILSASQQPADVASAIEMLWRDPQRRRTLSRAGAEGVRAHYTIEQMADRTVAVYSELLTNRAARTEPHQNVSVASR
jgi:glycosyltransferase involved in cell wall biosynthesis